MSIEHKNAALTKRHAPHNWEYADATARGAATGFVAGDVGKLARQLDDNSLWMLTDDSPVTWQAIGGGGGTTLPVADTTALVKGSADATKQLQFEVDGFTTGTTRVLTPPNYDGTIATLAGTETFTNKTLTTPKVVTSILDTNGNTVLGVTPTASAVNYLVATNQATGGGSANGPTLSSTGSDSSVDLNFDTKGTASRFQWKINSSTKMDYTDVGGGVFELRNLSGGYSGGGTKIGTTGLVFNSDSGINRLTAKVSGFSDGGSNLTGTFGSTATSPSQITGNQDNYNPGGASLMQRWSSDASRNVTGLTFATAQVSGQTHYIWNVGSQNIVLANESASSTAANRFTTSTGADLTLAANKCALVMYDSTTQRWRAVLLP